MMIAIKTPLPLQNLTLASGLQLEYVEQGLRGGMSLLCLHGITDFRRSFEPVLPWLPSGRHVIALSLRGHGRKEPTCAGPRVARRPRSDTDRLLCTVQDVRLREMPRAGNALHWEQPMAFAQEVEILATGMERGARRPQPSMA